MLLLSLQKPVTRLDGGVADSVFTGGEICLEITFLVGCLGSSFESIKPYSISMVLL